MGARTLPGKRVDSYLAGIIPKIFFFFTILNYSLYNNRANTNLGECISGNKEKGTKTGVTDSTPTPSKDYYPFKGSKPLKGSVTKSSVKKWSYMTGVLIATLISTWSNAKADYSYRIDSTGSSFAALYAG